MTTRMKTAARLNFRLTQELKELIDQAASLMGQTVSDFAISTLVDSARKILQQHHTTVLSKRDGEVFLKILDADAKPNAALRRAMRRYEKRYGTKS